MKKLYYASFFYAVLGLLAGIFYREATKHNGFTGDTALGTLHTHILVLGFIFFMVALCLGKLFSVHEAKSFGAWYYVYNLALLITVGTMAIRGMLQIDGADLEVLPYIAGLGHMILGIAIIWLLVLLGKRIK